MCSCRMAASGNAGIVHQQLELDAAASGYYAAEFIRKLTWWNHNKFLRLDEIHDHLRKSLQHVLC